LENHANGSRGIAQPDLGTAADPVDKRDGRFGHPPAGTLQVPKDFFLKRVALRKQLVKIDRSQP
jgi:hypothetical protein